MEHSIEEFKQFVKEHPSLRYEVRENKRTWQSIYEEWVLIGGDDDSWEEYIESESSKASTSSSSSSLESSDNQEFLKSALNYVKKVKPEDITKTIGNVQKVLGLVQAFTGGANKGQQGKGAPNMNMNYRPQRYIDPLFRRFDDYDD